MNTALVTGTIDHIHAVAIALKRAGFEALAWEEPSFGAADAIPPGSVGCYVQLPPAPVLQSARGAEPGGVGVLVQRVDAVARVSPLLASDSAVVLVADDHGWDPSRRRVLHALAGAAVAERVGFGVRVAVVDAAEAGDIAAAARRELGQARAVTLADLAPGMAYADWRDEVFNLTSSADPTYFCWRRRDGVRRAAVLRRSVLSPLPGAEEGALGLARAMLADALGAADPGDLQRWVESLADDFLAEVIGPLPADGFELPSHEVAAWVVRRSLSDGS